MSTNRWYMQFVILVSVLAVAVFPAQSQTIYGSIVGTVNDASSAAVQGATVTLTNNGTGEHRNVVSAPDGSYRFVNLIPGNYKVEAELAGFKRYVRDLVPVSVEAAA